MSKSLFVLFSVCIIPALLFLFQFYLCKKQSKFALILPLIVACFFVFIGFYALVIAGILFGIYFVMKQLRDKKREEQSELDRMNIQDL